MTKLPSFSRSLWFASHYRILLPKTFSINTSKGAGSPALLSSRRENQSTVRHSRRSSVSPRTTVGRSLLIAVRRSRSTVSGLRWAR
jgi:hypothetical protein